MTVAYESAVVKAIRGFKAELRAQVSKKDLRRRIDELERRVAELEARESASTDTGLAAPFLPAPMPWESPFTFTCGTHQ
ncbi:MAG TPA: hypothetical protein VFC57_04000 [Aeromicrobium sp.]|nr:hypothetical protein [Aeromicrobium sp.]